VPRIRYRVAMSLDGCIAGRRRSAVAWYSTTDYPPRTCRRSRGSPCGARRGVTSADRADRLRMANHAHIVTALMRAAPR
jgi:hypothetical protein